MSALRPLPPRPSLEFERKEAKALLRLLRAGDPDSIERARARHPAIDTSSAEKIRLADSQLVIAREYGFTSWAKLVRYFGDVERQRSNPAARRRVRHGNSSREASAGCSKTIASAGCTLGAHSPRMPRGSTGCALKKSSPPPSRRRGAPRGSAHERLPELG